MAARYLNRHRHSGDLPCSPGHCVVSSRPTDQARQAGRWRATSGRSTGCSLAQRGRLALAQVGIDLGAQAAASHRRADMAHHARRLEVQGRPVDDVVEIAELGKATSQPDRIAALLGSRVTPKLEATTRLRRGHGAGSGRRECPSQPGGRGRRLLYAQNDALTEAVRRRFQAMVGKPADHDGASSARTSCHDAGALWASAISSSLPLTASAKALTPASSSPNKPIDKISDSTKLTRTAPRQGAQRSSVR